VVSFVFLAPLEGLAAKPQKPVATAKAKSVATAKRGARPVKISAPARLPADPLKLPLKASVAYVIDQDSDQVSWARTTTTCGRFASLTKLMTGLVVAEAQLPLGERITITGADVDRLKFSSSRLQVGTQLTRREALHLALMSSENARAHALGRTYPGGEAALRQRHEQQGPAAGHAADALRGPDRACRAATSPARAISRCWPRPPTRIRCCAGIPPRVGYEVEAADGRELSYVNTNRLVREGAWNIGLQKTGYISEAGRAWSCRPGSRAATSSWCSSIRPARSRGSRTPRSCAAGWTSTARSSQGRTAARAPDA
jgi:D-alanyl-D-alanine endopeptidase (penicillin-binding protein 7)